MGKQVLLLMLKRLKTAYRILRGEDLIVTSNYYPYRIVQLVNFHDKLIAVDGEGKLWVMEFSPGGSWQQMYVTLVSDNPVRRY